MQVVECCECGLLYLNPRPIAVEIESWYGPSYFRGDQQSVRRGYENYLDHGVINDLRANAARKIALVSEHLRFKGSSVLELGCATGEACCAAMNGGAHVVGCDLSADAIQRARQRYPEIQFYCKRAHESPFLPASFDGILAFELIEHLTSPLAFVRDAGSLLRPGGILAISTPNSDCGRRVGWNRWLGFHASFEHLYFFGLSTLTRMLATAGLSVEGVYSQGDGRVGGAETSIRSLLRQTGLLQPATKIYRKALAPWATRWKKTGNDHTLLVVARKA